MRKKFISMLLVLTIFLCLIPSGAIFAQGAKTVVINEVCSSNKGKNGNLTKLVDESGDYCDWIELFNTTDKTVDLSGWGVSDKKSVPYKATLPSGTKIGPKARLVVLCSTQLAQSVAELYAAIGISSDGENVLITSPDGAVSDLVNVPALSSDTTYGRIPDGSDEFSVLLPTPDKSNSAARRVLPDPIFSHNSGFYKLRFDLAITAKSGQTIFYTTDGSDPANSQTRINYTEKIHISDRSGEKNVLSAVKTSTISPGSYTSVPDDDSVDKATVLRVCAIDGNGNCSQTVTKTYFVGSAVNSYGNMRVLSVTTDYDNLFDYYKGIYTNGAIYDEFAKENPGVTQGWLVKTNSTQRGKAWQRECNIELFEGDKTSVLSQDCAMSIQGGASRAFVQKSFRFTAKSEYGSSRFSYPLFGDDGLKKYKSFVVRNGGNSSQYLKYCDNFIQDTVGDRGFETQKGTPCIVFLDGEFWGVYVLQEDYSPDFFEDKYGVNADNVSMIQGGWELEEGTEDDFADFKTMANFISNNDMSVASNYKKAGELLDLDGYLNYMASQIYINNVDWPGGNWRIWHTNEQNGKSDFADGRWRMLMYDTEYSMYLYGIDKTAAKIDSFSNVLNSTNYLAKMFKSLMKNNEFKSQFYISFCDIANNNFSMDTAQTANQKLYSTYWNALLKNIKRYNISNSDELKRRFNQMNTFISQRRQYAMDYLEDHYSSGGKQNTVSISSNIPKAGEIALNTTSVDLEQYESNLFEGTYFANYEVSITAQEKIGYRFLYWMVDGEKYTDKTLSFKPTKAVSYIANYEKIVLPGDVNDDFAVNAKDVLTLRRYLAGVSVAVQAAACDLNGNGGIDSKDLLYLRQYLAGVKQKL